ncbi:MAG: hypothetical protein BYD32DRAFT_431860 [Podila humilis]|nr:MAG: hypothetical protein BYD32DRAFT_431860 [Podila humilis]
MSFNDFVRTCHICISNVYSPFQLPASNVVTANIHTELPSHFITDKARGQIDYGKFIAGEEEDYEDELNDRRSCRLEREKLAAIPVSFKLIDIPGLNDTSMFDEAILP